MPLFCPARGASNPRKNAYCEECGASLHPETTSSGAPSPAAHAPKKMQRQRPASPRRSVSSSRPRAAASSSDAPRSQRRVGVNRMRVADGQRAVNDVRSLLMWIGALNGLGLLLFSAVFIFAGDMVRQAPTLVVWLLLTGGAAAVAFVGAARAHRNPLPWAIAIAGLFTANIPLTVAAMGRFLSISSSIGAAVGAWAAIVPILKLMRAMKENPDDPAWAAIRGETTSSRMIDRNRRARRSVLAEFRSAGIAGGVILLVLVGLLATVFSSRAVIEALAERRAEQRTARRPSRDDQPDVPLAPTAERFEQAWAAGDFTAMGSLYPPRLRGRADRLVRRFESRGLSHPLPSLDARVIENYEPMKQQAAYATAFGDVEVVFEFTDDAWQMVALRLPG